MKVKLELSILKYIMNSINAMISEKIVACINDYISLFEKETTDEKTAG